MINMFGALGSVLKALDIRPHNSKSLASSLQDGSTGNSDFDSLLKSVLVPDKGNNVNEEELFSALVQERITGLKGSEAGDEFKAALDTEKSALKKPNGYIPVEQAAVNALKKMVADGKLSAEEGDSIYSDAFAAAQLDDNKGALYDSLGGHGDPTIAMATLDVAMSQAKSMLDKLTSGEEKADARSLSTAQATGAKGSSAAALVPSGTAGATGVSAGTVTPNGTTVDGADGFLWKPVSNSDGTVAVLLPAAMTNQVMSVLLKDGQGNTIEEGDRRSAGIVETGREKFSFTKAGKNYPKDISVEVTLADGTVKTYTIPDPSQRYD